MHVLLCQVRGLFEGEVPVCHYLGPRDGTLPHLTGPVGILLIRVVELGRPTHSGILDCI